MKIVFLLIGAINAVQCPEGWTKYPEGLCYKEFTEKLSWNSAETKCQEFGGDLVSIESQTEQDLILSIINRNHYDYYWIGLNDLKTAGQYEWITTDGTGEKKYKFKWWAKGMPTDNNGARCTFMLFSDHLPGDEDNGQLGKWTKGICGNKYKFVCKTLAKNVPAKCTDNYTYMPEVDKCYQIHVAKNEWHEAYDKCREKYNGNIVNIRSEAEMSAVLKEIDRKEVATGLWIGLSDFFTPGTLTWSVNQDQPSYSKWAYGQPNDDFISANKGATCAYIPFQSDSWEIRRCGDRDNAWMCERLAGKTCPPGWTFLKVGKLEETCVQFIVNGKDHAQWWSARQYCDSIGSRLFVPSSNEMNLALSKYYDDWRRAGVTQMWLGAVSTENCQFEQVNGYPLEYEGWGTNEPNCPDWNSENPQCAYLDISTTENNWHVGDCYMRDAFACQVDVGVQIHEIEKPVSEYYCKQDPNFKEVQFKLYEEEGHPPRCYQFLKNSGAIEHTSGNWSYAQSLCQSQGAQLASIHSPKQNSWMYSHTGNMNYWLGANKIKGKTPNTWVDGTSFDFTNWLENEPRNSYHDDGDCMKFKSNEDLGPGYWLARSCTDNQCKPICQKAATKGLASFIIKF